jgi:phenylacetate-CoA ligase
MEHFTAARRGKTMHLTKRIISTVSLERGLRYLLNAVSDAGLQAAGRFAGHSLSKALVDMKVAQWLSPEELTRRQNVRLNALLRYAVERVPYYKQQMKSPGRTAENLQLQSFPVMNKSLIRSRLQEFLATGVPEHRRMARRTSGSTGEPFLHYLDSDTIPIIYASHLFYDSWFGLRPFDKYLRIVFPHQPDHAGASASWLARARHRCTAQLKHVYERMTQEFVSVFEVGPEQIGLVYRRIAAFRPDFVLGYTSTLATAAEHLLEQGRELPYPIRGVITIGETVTPLRRKLIERYFRSPIINRYGLREFGGWSAQNCLSSPGLFHINTELVALEILKEDGTPSRSGETGRLVITDLFNRVMPIIRYDTGDLATQADEARCGCGRGFPQFGQIEGRAVESLLTRSGTSVSSIVLGRYLREGGSAFQYSDHLNFIRHYQAIQEDSLAVRFLVVPEPGFDSDRRQRLAGDLARLLGTDLEISVEQVAEIPLEPSGKRPLIKKAASAVGPRTIVL